MQSVQAIRSEEQSLALGLAERGHHEEHASVEVEDVMNIQQKQAEVMINLRMLLVPPLCKPLPPQLLPECTHQP